MQMMKPDAAIYAAVEQQTGRDPATLFFTDDSPKNIAAAKARGWQTHHFTSARGLGERLVQEGLLTAAETRL